MLLMMIDHDNVVIDDIGDDDHDVGENDYDIESADDHAASESC